LSNISDSNVSKKFSFAETKTPFSVKNLLEELGTQPFSISTDSSNHKEDKLFPFVVRFSNARKVIQVRLLDMNTLPVESSIHS
jgi:hypothetical protein